MNYDHFFDVIAQNKEAQGLKYSRSRLGRKQKSAGGLLALFFMIDGLKSFTNCNLQIN